MSSIHETQPTIQRLLSDSEFIGALDLISTSQDVLAKDLGGIHSFRWGALFYFVDKKCHNKDK